MKRFSAVNFLVGITELLFLMLSLLFIVSSTSSIDAAAVEAAEGLLSTDVMANRWISECYSGDDRNQDDDGRKLTSREDCIRVALLRTLLDRMSALAAAGRRRRINTLQSVPPSLLQQLPLDSDGQQLVDDEDGTDNDKIVAAAAVDDDDVLIRATRKERKRLQGIRRCFFHAVNCW
jgi:hypothetical protein